MPGFFYNLSGNVIRCFRGHNLLWHFAAIVVTYISVTSRFDWLYFESFSRSAWLPFLFPAVRLGSRMPIIAPLTLYFAGVLSKDGKIMRTSYALGQAVLISLLISSSYKAFTGRVHPPRIFGPNTIDVSREFHFGFLRGGIFWGRPSSHTTIAFAMAVTLFMLFRERRIIKYLSLCYALYIGLGVSISIHWFSDCLAGAIIGTVVGVVVSKSFLECDSEATLISQRNLQC